jgi:orotate phosphoribosyltransferase
MTKQVQFRRGTTAQHTTFTGALAEVTVDTDKKTLVVHDGATAGGSVVATQASAIAFAIGMGW